MTAESASGVAVARAALAGNPSDGYGGAVLAVTVPAFTASAEVVTGTEPEPEPDLIRAARARFAREHCPEAAGTRLRWSTTIPRSVGLGGSSALVIATLRALCEHHDVELDRVALAELALAVETEELGIAAGPQDRVAQSFGGLTFMDFAHTPPRYESLDPGLLPPLVVASRTTAAEPSGAVHDDLRGRFERGERAVRDGMAALARAAHDARRAVLARDHAALGRCLDASFDARRAMLPLDRRHVEMIELARAAGASANYTGSGGAIVCICPTNAQRLALCEALAGGGVLVVLWEEGQ